MKHLEPFKTKVEVAQKGIRWADPDFIEAMDERMDARTQGYPR